MSHIDKIYAERLCPDGDFEYRISKSRHFQRRSVRGITDRQIQKYRQEQIDSKRLWERDFEVERIAGHDQHDSLVIFKPHYQTGLEIRPGWFRHDVLSDDLKEEYMRFMAEADQEYAAMKGQVGSQAVQQPSKIARLMQGAFQAQVVKPVGAKLREVVLERYPHAFHFEDAIEAQYVAARHDPNTTIEEDEADEEAPASKDMQHSNEPVIPFYQTTTGIIGEDSTHYLFLNTGGSARWVEKQHIAEEWTEPYKKQKAQLIKAFQAHTGGKVECQGNWRPDLHLHGMFPVFLGIPTPVSDAIKDEVNERFQGLLVEESEAQEGMKEK